MVVSGSVRQGLVTHCVEEGRMVVYGAMSLENHGLIILPMKRLFFKYDRHGLVLNSKLVYVHLIDLAI